MNKIKIPKPIAIKCLLTKSPKSLASSMLFSAFSLSFAEKIAVGWMSANAAPSVHDNGRFVDVAFYNTVLCWFALRQQICSFF